MTLLTAIVICCLEHCLALQNCSGTAATKQLGELERLSKLAFKSHLTRTVQNEIEQAERLLGEVEGELHGGEGKIRSIGYK